MGPVGRMVGMDRTTFARCGSCPVDKRGQSAHRARLPCRMKNTRGHDRGPSRHHGNARCVSDRCVWLREREGAGSRAPRFDPAPFAWHRETSFRWRDARPRGAITAPPACAVPFQSREKPVANIHISSHPASGATPVDGHAEPHDATSTDAASRSPSSRSISSSPALTGLHASRTNRSPAQKPISVRRMKVANADASTSPTQANQETPITAPQPVRASTSALVPALGGYRVRSPASSRPASPNVQTDTESTSATPRPQAERGLAADSTISEPVKRYAPPSEPPPGRQHEFVGSRRNAPADEVPTQTLYAPPSGPPPTQQQSDPGAVRHYDPPAGPPPDLQSQYPHASFDPPLEHAPPLADVAPTQRPSKLHQTPQQLQSLINAGGQIADIVLSLTQAILQFLVKVAHNIEQLSRK